MHLEREQQAILDGAHGPTLQRQVRLLARLGDIYGAPRMIPVTSVQVAGVSYKSIGDPGLEFLEDIAAQGVRVKVPTTLNPAGMDVGRWKELGFPADFAEKQLRILSAFGAMGIAPMPTCTPYLVGNLPRFKDHLAWSESSAVSYANSVLGARSNREGGPSALASALLGFTPEYGLHLEANRAPALHVDVAVPLKFSSDFGALGYWVGKKAQNRIPYFTGITHAALEDFKALGAAMASSGAVALYHVEGLTPEAERYRKDGLPSFSYGAAQRDETLKSLDSGKAPDFIVIGCPHASPREIAEVAALVKGKTLKKPLWVCTSRMVKAAADKEGHTQDIEDAGGKVVVDTCMVVSPMEKLGFKVTAVNSGKAANYLPGFCKQDVVFRDTRSLVQEALS